MQWFYSDKDGQERGPYDSTLMRCWFEGGLLPDGVALSYRLKVGALGTSAPLPLSALFPDVSNAFLEPPTIRKMADVSGPPSLTRGRTLPASSEGDISNLAKKKLSERKSSVSSTRASLRSSKRRVRTHTAPDISEAVKRLTIARLTSVSPRAGAASASVMNCENAHSAVSYQSMLTVLQSFVPEIAMRQAICAASAPLEQCKRLNCAVVLADISGFTRLTESLASLGDKGSEMLTLKLNSYFGKMIDKVYAQGGDVVKFAGDALVIIWRGKSTESDTRRVKASNSCLSGRVSSRDGDSDPAQDRPPTLCPTSRRVEREGEPTHEMEMTNVCMECRAVIGGKPSSPEGAKQKNKFRNIVKKLISGYHEGEKESDEEGSRSLKYSCALCRRILCRACSANTVANESSRRRYLVCAHCNSSIVSKLADEERLDLKARRASFGKVLNECVECCLGLIETLDNFENLRLHIGIGVGEAILLHVGGELDRWEFIVAGDAVSQMGEAEASAAAGEICISSLGAEILTEIRPLIEDGMDSIELGLELADNPFAVRVLRGTGASSAHPLEPLSWNSKTSRLMQIATSALGTTEALWQRVCETLMGYVPGAVRDAIRTSTTHTVSEFRRVTVLFINLPGTDYSRPSIHEELNETLTVLQKQLYKFEGSMRQIIADDKGTQLIAVFGLYPFAHENDALIATRCAMSMVETCSVPCKIGIATGMVYAGTVGSPRRCEYAVIGDTVNLSARLMSAAKKLGGKARFPSIYCAMRRHTVTRLAI